MLLTLFVYDDISFVVAIRGAMSFSYEQVEKAK